MVKHERINANQVCAYGVSAGGLLMGAVANMRPDLFRAMIMKVRLQFSSYHFLITFSF